MSTKKKILFIINPNSGHGRNEAIAAIIEEHIDRTQYEVSISFTEKPHHATELAKEAAANGFHIVAVVGGDGSVNETGKGLIGSNTALAIIPRGSGNGMARHLKIPLDAKKAIQNINNGNITEIDTLDINGRVCIGMSGIGFDAHVAHCFADYGKRGFSSYIKIVLREYAKFQPYKVQLETNGEVLNPSIFMLSFANSSQFGNDAFISPQSDMRDGKFEVCILKRLDTTSIPAFGYKLMTGKLKSNDDFKIISTKEVRVSKYAEKILHIDGEAIQVEEDFIVKVNPLSLRIVVPAL